MDKKEPTASVSTLRFVEPELDTRHDSTKQDGPGFVPPHPQETQTHPQLWRNISSIRLLLSSYTACLIFSVLYCLFIYHVLIRQHARVGAVLFDAPTSNLLISVFSQVFALLADSLICGLLDILRAALASREGGTSASAFFGISGATGWLSVFRLASANGFRDGWCNFRLLVPVLGLLFGSVLKFQATFDYHFAPGLVSTPVYAGLVPIDIRLLQNVRSADLWIYFQSFTSILLGHPRYSVPFSIDSCAGNCTSFLLPGGLEMARRVSPHLNLTVFHGGIFDGSEVINVDRSRGMVLKFERMPPDYEFDWSKECLYAGAQINDSVQICAAQAGDSVIAGWTSCPQQVFDARACETDQTWKQTAMPWTTRMTGFFQPTSATYDRANGSIISAKPLSLNTSDHVPLSAADYLTLYRKILIPSSQPCQTFDQSCALESAKINSITYDITWLHRTYQVSFPDQADAPVTYLRNFLAVPLQFGVVAVEFANYTQDPNLLKLFFGGDGLPLPEAMRTLAMGGSSASKLVIREWTGWAFIAGAVAMLVVVTAGMAWVLAQPVRVIGGSGIPEIDILRYGGVSGMEGDGIRTEKGLMVLPGSKLEDRISGWRLASALRHWGVVSVRDERRTALIAVPRKGSQTESAA